MPPAPDRSPATGRPLLGLGILVLGALVILFLNGWDLARSFPWMLIAVAGAAGFALMSGRRRPPA